MLGGLGVEIGGKKSLKSGFAAKGNCGFEGRKLLVKNIG